MNTPLASFYLGKGIWVWDLEPSILIGLALWTALYIGLTRRRAPQPGQRLPEMPHPVVPALRQVAFHTGTLLALLALVSPLDTLSDHFLLSAHMVQHLLLLTGAPPLWLYGVPPGRLDRLKLPAKVGGALRRLSSLTHPLPAFILYNVVLFGWHIPRAYDAALLHPWLHILEHLSFMAVALAAWWPVLGFLPRSAPRASQPAQMGYLFMIMLASTGLGAFIALARNPLYPFYLSAPGVINGVIFPAMAGGPRLWGLSVMADQQLSGLIMWIPGNLVYFGAIMIVLAGWLKNQESAARALETESAEKND